MQANPAYPNGDYLKEYAPNIQAFAPMIENLSQAERFSLIKMIASIPFLPLESLEGDDEPSLPLSREEIAKKRLGVFKGQITMSDDFDDYLGDDFWFPDDDILYQ